MDYDWNGSLVSNIRESISQGVGGVAASVLQMVLRRNDSDADMPEKRLERERASRGLVKRQLLDLAT
jgi:hypothetical protein